MPIHKKWSRFTEENVKKLPKETGVYELANKDKRNIDIGGSDGKTTKVRGRLLRHLSSNKYPTAKYFRCKFAGLLDSGIDMEAQESAKFQKKHGRKPRYTKRSPKRKSRF